MIVHRKTLLLCILSIFVSTIAQADFINLNDFFFFPGDPVTVASDGSSATIGELAGISPILLSNDPGFGDLKVIPAGTGLSLVFDFSFIEGVGSDDEFGVFIIDVLGPTSDPALQFFTQATGSGSVSFDLSLPTITPFAGGFVGLQFQLSSDLNFDFVDDLNSTVTVSNAHTDVIPEPGTILLLTTGLAGMAGYSGIRFRRKKKQ